MNSSRDRFLDLMKNEILKLDLAELDFGIYRILNHRKDEIEAFFDDDLPKVLDEAMTGTGDDGTVFAESEEDHLYNALFTFFSRYYRDGDFQPQQRRANDARYSVPYNGEDVHFHWRSKGSHYIKTTEELKSYSFRSGGWKVRFEFVEAFQEPDNVKGTSRYFVPVPEECRVDVGDEGNLFIVPFAFRKLTADETKRWGKKSKTIDGDSTQERLINDVGGEIDPPAGVTKTDLLFHMNRYAKKNRTDYFVHPHLGDFLRGELDFYLKNEFLDIQALTSPDAVADRLTKMRAVREVANRIVDMLDEIESFQATLFEKRKFVLSNSYLVPIRMIPEELWDDVLANKVQIEQWRRDFGLKGRISHKTLESRPSLVADTSLFDPAFQVSLLAELDGVSDLVDGLLVNAENFAALRTLSPALSNTVDVIYIDPPYNTGGDGFMYIDEFSRHSSWVSMMDSRLRIARRLLKSTGALFASIDDNEHSHLLLLLDEVFGRSNMVGDVAVAKGTSTGQDGSKFGSSVDHLCCYRKSEEFFPSGVPLSSKDIERFNREDSRGQYSILQLRKTGNNDRREDRPNLYYGVVSPDGSEVFPIGPTGYESRWRVGRSTYDEWDRNGYVEWVETERGLLPYVKYYLEDRTKRPSTLWSDLDGNKAATREQKALFGDGVFANPKPTALVERVARIGASPEPTVLDFFAGSGTSGHAIVNLNRERGATSRFILVEMGEFFDSVLKRRIAKVMYAPEWKSGLPKTEPIFTDGIPEWVERSPRLVQVIKLESYEDSLNSLVVGGDDQLGNEHRIRYAIPDSVDESAVLLATDRLESPFDYQLEVHTDEGVEFRDVDLVTTFNLIRGIRPKRYRELDHEGRRYVVIDGVDSGKSVLVLWRSVADLDPEAEREFLSGAIPEALGTELADYEIVWHNADSAIPNSMSLDAEFKRLMFEPEPALS